MEGIIKISNRKWLEEIIESPDLEPIYSRMAQNLEAVRDGLARSYAKNSFEVRVSGSA